ncbi:MAG: SDR family oxidoreductase [Longimicrobiales bacterium]|nr:SDR family oxidoreductase [Longimicrobiales bacterium]
MSELAGYNAVVTGGGRGIGAAAAIALAEAGARVSVAARNETQVVEIAGEIRTRGYEAFAFRCDVTDPHQVRDLALSAREAMGRIDILVNNAGTATSNPLPRITLAEWEHIMDVNAKGTFLCSQAVYDGMVKRRWGRIVNVASIAGIEGDKYISAYTAAKHAVVGFTRAMAVESKGSGVTFNAVCPGYVDTPLTDETIARIMQQTGRSWQDSLEALLEQADQPRLIRAHEVAEAIRSLCLEDAGSRNGELVILHGREAA